jgi:hypothetical protein
MEETISDLWNKLDRHGRFLMLDKLIDFKKTHVTAAQATDWISRDWDKLLPFQKEILLKVKTEEKGFSMSKLVNKLDEIAVMLEEPAISIPKDEMVKEHVRLTALLADLLDYVQTHDLKFDDPLMKRLMFELDDQNKELEQYKKVEESELTEMSTMEHEWNTISSSARWRLLDTVWPDPPKVLGSFFKLFTSKQWDDLPEEIQVKLQKHFNEKVGKL